MKWFLEIFRDVKKQYDSQPTHDHELICRSGIHMASAVLKLQKKSWTNDDLSKIANQTGFFFSIWITENDIHKNRANYNIHALKLRQLDHYRLTSNKFCNEFRAAFASEDWPNVSIDYGCQTLMQGWFEIDKKLFARDVLSYMNRFQKNVAPIIDDLLKQRVKS